MLAGLISAAHVVGNELGEFRMVLLGVGVAGALCARLLVHAGIGDIVAVDRTGILHPGIAGRDGLTGEIDDALRGAHALIGAS